MASSPALSRGLQPQPGSPRPCPGPVYTRPLGKGSFGPASSRPLVRKRPDQCLVLLRAPHVQWILEECLEQEGEQALCVHLVPWKRLKETLLLRCRQRSPRRMPRPAPGALRGQAVWPLCHPSPLLPTDNSPGLGNRGHLSRSGLSQCPPEAGLLGGHCRLHHGSDQGHCFLWNMKLFYFFIFIEVIGVTLVHKSMFQIRIL